MQRTAQEGYVPADGLALRQAGDGLNNHGLKDGRSQILLARTIVDERLNVGLGEHAAARGNGIE